MSARAMSLALTLGLVLSSVGCVAGTDDELEPRPTPTVTVTGTPRTALPQTLPLEGSPQEGAPEGSLDFSDSVVWAVGSTLHVDGEPVDLAPLVPEEMVVLETGILVRTGSEVWLTAGREASGLPLPPVTSMGLSRDGSQLLFDLADRPRFVAYRLDGERVAPSNVGVPRTEERIAAGPGRYVVVDGGESRVEDASGGSVEVSGLPADFAARGWTSPDAAYGLGTADESDASGLGVHTCDLVAGGGACVELERLPDDTDPEDLVFGAHPDG